MMLPAALVAALTLGDAPPAEPASLFEEGSVLSVVIENDIFAGRDRNYTNGLRLEHVSPANKVNPWLRRVADAHPLIDLSRADLRQGFALSHTIYTPDDITDPDPPPGTRPYAGYLGFTGFATARTANVERTAVIEIGLVGPAAGGRFVQENWHRLIDGRLPRGWDTQLENELVFALSGHRLHRLAGPDLGGLETDAVLHAGAAIGTLRTNVSAGATVRIGLDLASDYAPPRIRPALAPSSIFAPGAPRGGYLFAGFGWYAVAQDIFLDGNTFTGSRSVERRGLVGDFQAGAALHFTRHRLAFTYVVRSEQFVGQDEADAFGAVSLSYAF